MRIETTGGAIFRPLQATSQQTGTGLCFEDLFLADTAEAGSTEDLSSHAHSFNAFGLLGMGATLGDGEADSAPAEQPAAVSPSADGKLYPASVTAVLAQAASFATPAVTPPEPQAAGVFVKEIRAASGGVAPGGSPGVAVSRPGQLAVIPGFKASPGILNALIKTESLGGELIRAGLFSPAADLPEAETRAQAEAARPEPHEVADGAEDLLSVTVSEGDGVFHVAAAARGLTEEQRQKLLSAAQEAAGEARIRLGDLYLNGSPIRKFPRSFDRSFPWQLHL